ncbi:DUF6542 domain-containing protein [Nocardia sp. NPDC051030]|uniref:DUF6542 domain-containing protein n=1 Tax=Nocardia sp. NPDC051030 TaxID=3155162 RepID=UPI0034169127
MAVTERERTEVPSSHRSILPSVPGVPAWAAVLIAVTCAFIGFFIDASGGGDDLTGTFATLYVVGCVLAALVVRYKGLFTTMVLPPLLLFIAVPLAYQQLLGSASSLKVKEILLNLAIPLVNRFPTMALATVLVLIVGAVRVALHRREHEGASGSGKSGGLAKAKARARTARAAGAARAQRTRPTDPKDPARRRSRVSPDTAADAAEPAANARRSRRPSGRTADGPPRVGADNRQAAPDRTRAARQPAADRTRAAGNRATPAEGRTANRKPPADRTPPADRKPGAERKPPPDRQAAANPPTEGRRRRNPNSEVPPHPRPNVRYRERDSGRIER